MVIDYCIVDSELVVKIYDKLNILISSIEMSNMCYLNIDEYYCTGSSAKYRNQLFNICLDKNIIATEQTHNIQNNNKGGFVFEPDTNIHEWCSVLDFNSLYPSILIAYNICYTTFLGKNIIPSTDDYYEICNNNDRYYFIKSRKGIIPELCDFLLKERKIVKNKIKTLNKPEEELLKIILDQRQNIIKITANSIYGLYSSGYPGIETFREGAECITAIGRQYLQKMKLDIEKYYNAKVVYGDTDSCMVKFINEENIPDEEFKKFCIDSSHRISSDERICGNWIKPISVKYELLFQVVIFTAKKRYAGIQADPVPDTVYIKGTMKSTMCEYAKIVFKKVLLKILNKTTTEELKEYITNLLKNLKNVELKDLSFGNKFKSYYANNSQYKIFKENKQKDQIEVPIGERVDLVYIKSNSKFAGDKLELLSLAKKENIDYNYYVEKQILNNLENELLIFDKNLYYELKNFRF
ncbi:DNA-directed DNA polymerase delta [Boothiomyces sp. JEL0866]|nr:DNA-directed DNA polymerase delta [Boothiomyces sp. JEL0866]